ncbi:hypothetical protein ACFO1B_42020 [Dactylosporangium siamense]|uniref:Uncharacterized protein n=1 Tax=Dactylosporangium siamense TaxID=685454 RepID=A0A919PJW5_9ACTN|nr:hypothetical protein [Dactylosporangium siamense]GIG44852.1 hypothetical protein Dsi01nite_028930 [Dactylosporangium siamense]
MIELPDGRTEVRFSYRTHTSTQNAKGVIVREQSLPVGMAITNPDGGTLFIPWPQVTSLVISAGA